MLILIKFDKIDRLNVIIKKNLLYLNAYKLDIECR